MFMEPRPLKPRGQFAFNEVRPKWWHWDYGWRPISLDLDALHEVEERLTEKQWNRYITALIPIETNEDELQLAVHASAEQKISALAYVLWSTRRRHRE